MLTSKHDDGFGRQTLIPAADAPEASLGDIALSYFDDDLAHSISQDGVTTTFALDPAGRRLTQTTTGGTGTTSLLRQYGDDSDNPAWATNQDGYLMRFTPSLDGLGAVIDADGNANMMLANPHGDNVTTITIGQSQAESVPVTQIGGWADYTEYGVSKRGQSRGWGYGWLGSHERATMPETAGLTLMGSRLYNPVRGAFTSVDPVPGGNTTAYTYPQDPIGQMDLDGQSKKSKAKKFAKKWLKRACKHREKHWSTYLAVGVCAATAGAGCAAATAIAIGVSAHKGAKACKGCTTSGKIKAGAKSGAVSFITARGGSLWRGGRYVSRASGKGLRSVTVKKWSTGIQFRSASGRILRGSEAAKGAALGYGCSRKKARC
ncbi:MAG: hypothetical protein GX678_07055 [Actinomycetales bacterium]|nr:hypothetical protein [Actinomycetales bacterium]